MILFLEHDGWISYPFGKMLTYDDSFCAGSNIFTSEEIEALPYKWLPNRQARDLHIF